jgi:hypothetical protein
MKKLITLVVCVSLLFSHPAQANFFTDLLGGLFTVVSYPFQLILGSTKAPFFVSQNPFVEKEWHKEERLAAERKPKLTAPVKPPEKEPINQEDEPKNPEKQQSPTATPIPTPSSPDFIKDTLNPSQIPKNSNSKRWLIIEGICYAVGAIVGAGIVEGGLTAVAKVTLIGGGGAAAVGATAIGVSILTIKILNAGIAGQVAVLGVGAVAILEVLKFNLWGLCRSLCRSKY